MKTDRQRNISFLDLNAIETGPSADRDLFKKIKKSMKIVPPVQELCMEIYRKKKRYKRFVKSPSLKFG